MAGYGMGNYGYGYNNIPMKSPQQLQQEYSNLMQQYQNIYNTQYQNNMPIQSPNSGQVSSSPSISGSYTKVSNYSEVENAPTPTDGTANLFFDFEHGVFWSKKFANGQHTIQSFTFRPLNQNGDVTPSKESEQAPVKEDNNIIQEPVFKEIDLSGVYERLDKIENKLSKLGTTKNTSSGKQKLLNLEG